MKIYRVCKKSVDHYYSAMTQASIAIQHNLRDYAGAKYYLDKNLAEKMAEDLRSKIDELGLHNSWTAVCDEIYVIDQGRPTETNKETKGDE